MVYPVIHSCPICSNSLRVKKLECSHCHTRIENDFTLSKFASLSVEQMNFVEVFLVSRGNIKEVEKELGISYPTVRSRLNEIIELLGHGKQKEKTSKHNKSDIISMLDNDEISTQEAIKLLREGD
ncbi:DUF2089 domain-containing protein [Pseudogracilibacillus sp. SE30717A]|uniref:DUF2089 domain-containing protein n=1 Tax=Pseudogracilibacillus sp. SE30717A TaxID=3098293 RepID=UPI00300DE48E